MLDSIGKICPFCKTEIKEGDAVKVCPACAIPHHGGCWEENNGCTTFGCSEQHYEPQGTNATDVCEKCGAVLGDGQAFCPKCGTPKNTIKANVCGKCGADLQDGQVFCSKCGQKVGLAVDSVVNKAIRHFNASIVKIQKNSKITKEKRNIFLIIGAIAALIIAIVLVLSLKNTHVNNKIVVAKENISQNIILESQYQIESITSSFGASIIPNSYEVIFESQDIENDKISFEGWLIFKLILNDSTLEYKVPFSASGALEGDSSPYKIDLKFSEVTWEQID